MGSRPAALLCKMGWPDNHDMAKFVKPAFTYQSIAVLQLHALLLMVQAPDFAYQDT